VLFGFSNGSFTAFLMACELAAMGETLKRLVLFDTPIPGRLHRLDRARVFSERVWHVGKAIAALPREAALERATLAVRNVANQLALKIRRPAPPPVTHFDRIDLRNQALVDAYARGPLPVYPGRITIVLGQRTSHAGVSAERDARRFWRFHAADGIEVHEVDSTHLEMLEPPDVDALGSVLRKVIASD
jgi:thioesterase domain-containing protein